MVRLPIPAQLHTPKDKEQIVAHNDETTNNTKRTIQNLQLR